MNASERGPSYDWKHEAEHYRAECDKLRDLLGKVETMGERDAHERDELVALLQSLNARVDPGTIDTADAYGLELLAARREIEEFKRDLHTTRIIPGTEELHAEIERLKGLQADHLADMRRVQDAEREVERLRAQLKDAETYQGSMGDL